MTPEIEPRRPLHGSCHCGHMKYVLFVSMPPAVALEQQPDIVKQSRVRFYKCNCSTCHKTGFFHMRLPDPPNDFFLLSPTDTKELSDYTCFDHELHWLFCKNCGVRCFIVQGEGKTEEVDLQQALSGGVKVKKKTESTTEKAVTVWRLDPEFWTRNRGQRYLSVNALTIDHEQPEDGQGLDLRKLVDSKWLEYLDCKDDLLEPRYDYPHEGGTW